MIAAFTPTVTQVPQFRSDLYPSAISIPISNNRPILKDTNSFFVLTQIDDSIIVNNGYVITDINEVESSFGLYGQFNVLTLASSIFKESKPIDDKFLESINYTFKRLGSKTPKRI